MPETLRLAGVQELADLLGIDEEAVRELPQSDTLYREGTPFPRPVAELVDHGPIWRLDDLEAWQVARRAFWRDSR